MVESRDGQPDEVIYWITLCDDCLARGPMSTEEEAPQSLRELFETPFVQHVTFAAVVVFLFVVAANIFSA